MKKAGHGSRFNIFSFFVVLFLLIVVLYHKLPFTFYQQDEWQVLGSFMTDGIQSFLSSYSFTPLNIFAGKGRLLSIPIQYIFYHYFPFQVAQAAVFAIFLHFLNSVVLFVVLKRLFKNIFLSVIAVLFFATASVSSQSITWMAASTTTLLSAFFAFASLLSYVVYIERKRPKWIWITLGLFVVSFFLKESSIFLLFIYPLTYFLYFRGKISLRMMVKDHLPFIFYLLLLIVSVFIYIFSEKNPTGLIVTAAPNSELRLLLHLILYPFLAFSQVFIGGEIVYKMADSFGSLSYSRIWTEPFSVIVRETIAADFVSFLLTVCILVFLFAVSRNDKQLKKPILWGVVFTLLSFLPYAVLDKQTSYFESRYYYFAVVGGGVLFATVVVLLSQLLVKYFKISANAARLICLLLAALYITYQISLIHTSLSRDLRFADERKDFLVTLDTKLPRLKNKALFYIIGNTEYSLKENRVPFQQGIGYTLMVWYYDSGSIPKELIKSNFLWVIGSEGYREVGEKGFGVYSNYDALKDEVINSDLSVRNVYGLYYDGKTQELIDISDMVRASFDDSKSEKNVRLLSNI